MANEQVNTTLQFGADITDFKAAMQEANRSIKLANSEFAAASSGMDDWSSSTDGLSAKLRQLSSVQEAEQRKLDVLQTAYAKVAAEQGANSAAAQDLLVKINNQQAAVNKAERNYNAFAAKLDEVESAAGGAATDIKKAGDAAEDAGTGAKDSADGWTIAKDVISDFVSNAIQGAIDALVSVAEATRDYRREMAQLQQNATDAGQDMGAMKETLADVAAVTGETDAAMEGLNMLMATKLDTTQLDLAAKSFAGAATKFDGLKFEGLAEGLQESLAVGSAVGPFAELIERTGGNLEAFNEGMAACSTEAERQQYAMQWLSESGLKDVHDSYVQNNADLVAAEKAQFRYNDALASVGAAVEPINTKLSEIGATILEQVAPIIEDIVGWVLENLPTITPIITGIAAALGVLAAAMAIQGIISGVTKAFALLNTTMLANPIVLIVAAIAGLVAAFVALWNKSEAFRNFWKGMWDGIVNAFNAVVNFFKNAASNIGKFFSNAWNGIKNAWASAKNYFSNIRQGITKAFANVDSWMSSKFGGAWTAIKTAFSSFVGYFKQLWESLKAVFSAVKSVLSGNFSDAWKAIKGAFAGWGNYFSGLWENVKSIFSNVGGSMLNVGKNIVQGIWNGISGAFQWIKDKISGWVGNVLGFIKNLFGIHSPSRVMRDEVGKMLGLGMAEGITDSRKAVNGAVRKLGDAALGGLPTSGGGTSAAGAAGGRTIIFNQTNNSPRALSRREIYRQTHNALSFAGGA